MLLIDGTYYLKVDPKGRIMLPSALKEQLLPILEEGFIMKYNLHEPCIDFVARGEWEKQKEQLLRSLSPNSQQASRIMRRYMAGKRDASIDKSGRLHLPIDLQDYSGITTEVVITALLNRIEIWDKKAYEADLKQSIPDLDSILNRSLTNSYETDKE